MFKFLKDKLKGAISKFSEKVDEEAKEETKEEEISEEEVKEEEKQTEEDLKKAEEEKKKKQEEIKKLEQEKKKAEAEKQEKLEQEKQKKQEEIKKIEKQEQEKQVQLKQVEEKKGLFAKLKDKITKEKPSEEKKKSFIGKITQTVTTKRISESQFDDIFWELEVILLENNVAVEVIEKIKSDLKDSLVDKPIERRHIQDKIISSLKQSIDSLFETEKINLIEKSKEKKPLIICFVGINGSGKTTSIAKIAKYLQNNNLTCVLAASDTFRAAAIDQLQQHADKLDIKLIKHDYGADPAAVAFDAVEHAKAKNIDVVLIDTAGRMHSNANLMEEMKKLIKVANPDLKLFIGESITGNDCVEQAKQFNDAVSIDGIILSKADIDEKGGAAISVSHVTGKPILFIGTGQEYDDLKEFDKDIILDNLGL